MSGLKLCATCNKKKPFSEFYSDKHKKDGFNRECKPCNKARGATRRKTVNGRTREILRHAKERAVSKNMKYNLDYQWAYDLIESGTCQVTGLVFDLSPSNKTFRNPYAPSLDRIDSSKGYLKSNCRFVLDSVNTALNEHDDDIMLPIIKAMAKGLQKIVKKK